MGNDEILLGKKDITIFMRSLSNKMYFTTFLVLVAMEF